MFGMRNLPFVILFSLLVMSGLPRVVFAQTPEEVDAQLEALPKGKEKVIALLKASQDLAKSNPPQSIEYAKEAADLSVEIKDIRMAGEANSQLGLLLLNQTRYKEALIPFKKAITYRKRYVKRGNRGVKQYSKIASDYNFLGIAYERLGQISEAEKLYESQKYYAMKGPDNQERAYAFLNIGKSALRNDRYSSALKSLNQAKIYAQKANLKRTLLDIETYIQNANVLMQKALSEKEYQDELKSVSQKVEKVQDSLDEAIETAKVTLEEKELVEMELREQSLALELEAKERKLAEEEKKLAKQELEAEKKQRELERRNYQTRQIGGLLVGILLLWIALTMWQRALERKRDQAKIQEEKDRADRLLVNILPENIAEELKSKNVVEPVEHPKVTILFTDFKGFTRLAAGMSPKELLEHLQYAFHHFDIITTKYGLEKIKTIGDAYMAVAGLVGEDAYQGINTVAAGMEMQQFMNKWNIEQRQKGEPEWKLRVGIHTGKVVAGVIGEKKFAYDIWGDDVNVAARMESASDPGKVNISEATYKEVAPFVRVEPMRTVPIKNRGEVGMYFVEKITAKRTAPAS